MTYAAKTAGVGRRTVYDLRAVNPDFARAWDEALESSVGKLEVEAFRRAVHGTEKPVYQGGLQVGTVREYSDTLLIFLLKARRPGLYREYLKTPRETDGESLRAKHDRALDSYRTSGTGGTECLLDRIDRLTELFRSAAATANQPTQTVE